jgi:phosphoenolpyruvate carboxylase
MEGRLAAPAVAAQHPPMTSPAAPLLDRLRALRRTAATDPFANPVLSMALAISRMMDGGGLDPADLNAVVADLRDAAFADRAGRLRARLDDPDRIFATMATRLARPDPADSPVPWAAFREAAQRPRAAAVFTAHPTFAATPAVYAALAAGAA